MKLILSFCAGFALSTALAFLFVVPRVKENWRAQGDTTGFLRAHRQVHLKAAQYFSDQPGNCKDVAVLTGAKPAVIVVVDCGNYKTLRVENHD